MKPQAHQKQTIPNSKHRADTFLFQSWTFTEAHLYNKNKKQNLHEMSGCRKENKFPDSCPTENSLKSTNAYTCDDRKAKLFLPYKIALTHTPVTTVPISHILGNLTSAQTIKNAPPLMELQGS
jgi:hypothetical protein